jgi:hypothetical protein
MDYSLLIKEVMVMTFEESETQPGENPAAFPPQIFDSGALLSLFLCFAS